MGQPRGRACAPEAEWFGRSLAVHDLIALATDAAPAGPEDQREQGADRADDEENPADGRQLETADTDVHGPDEDRADRDQQQAYSDAHQAPFPLGSGVFP